MVGKECNMSKICLLFPVSKQSQLVPSWKEKLYSIIPTQVHFEVRDILNADFDGCIYDVIYSQNSIYHIAKKEELFAKLYVSYHVFNLFWLTFLFDLICFSIKNLYE